MRIYITPILIVLAVFGLWFSYKQGYQDGVNRVNSYVKYNKVMTDSKIAELENCCSKVKP